MGLKDFLTLKDLAFFIVVCLCVYLMLFNNDNEEYYYYNMTYLEENVNANGFYTYDEYFCVVTKDRSMEDISRTTFHELAHVFSMRDYEHFCREQIELGVVESEC
jgi:hypothetical protein